MLDRVEELISQPGAPNLYWALTALPRPLVSMREALETEQRMGENMVPELARPTSPIPVPSGASCSRSSTTGCVTWRRR